MPLSIPALGAKAIYAECNTPPAGSTDVQIGPITYDTFYDPGQSEISGADLTAMLAGLGLSYASGSFTALLPVTLAVTVQVTVKASPGGADSVWLGVPDYPAGPRVTIANPNTLGTVLMERTFVMNAGEILRLGQTCANASDTPLTYATISIVRLA